MRKILVLTVIALTLAIFGTELMAQGGKGKGKSNAPKTNWVDANGDGVCDNVGTAGTNNGAVRPNYIDADGDGICDNANGTTGKGQRLNFVDANGDGVCDNAGTGTCTGTKQGKGFKGKRNGTCTTPPAPRVK